MQQVTPTVTEEQFKQTVEHLLGNNYERGVKLFRECPNLSFDITNVLFLAAAAKKLEEALPILEQHWSEHLVFQHPLVRGLVVDNMLGVNPTTELLARLAIKYNDIVSH